jgi:hypothetical protein
MGSFERQTAPSQRTFIEALAKEKTKRKRDAAVFIVELNGDVDEAILDQATHQLEDLVGSDRLTFFRVR